MQVERKKGDKQGGEIKMRKVRRGEVGKRKGDKNEVK